MRVPALLSDPAFPLLKQRLIEYTGLAYYSDKDADLALRLDRRLVSAGAPDCAAYLRILDGPAGAKEIDAIVADLTVGETYFFRQKEQFDALRDIVFPDVIARNRPRRSLRIWSAGCATGAEPYSVSMLLRREFADQLAGWDVSIAGTDINRDSLRRAKEGRFDEWAFRECSPDLKTCCFERAGRQWAIKPQYKEGVRFERHNLAVDPLPSAEHGLFAFDLILCRNVMIYFSPEAISATAGRLYECLAGGGWLVVGHAEPNRVAFGRFAMVMRYGVSLYQKPAAVSAGAAPALPAVEPAAEPPAPVQAIARTAVPRRSGARRHAGINLHSVRQLADTGQLEAAAASCSALVRSDSRNPLAHYMLGLILEQSGSPRQAETALENAIELDWQFVLAHYHLGLVRTRTGAAAQAWKAFKNALEILGGRGDDEAVEQGDGITVAQLRELAAAQLKALPKP